MVLISYFIVIVNNGSYHRAVTFSKSPKTLVSVVSCHHRI